MENYQNSCRIFYRYRPSGEHKYRIIAVRNNSAKALSTLVYSNEVQAGTKSRAKEALRAGFGLAPKKTAFTKLAKNRVRDACAVLDKKYGKRCLFTTGTLPAETEEARSALSMWSGYLIQVLKQWLRDNFSGVETVWVWELQKRGALHLHCVFAGPDVGLLQTLANAWNKKWYSLLRLLSDKSGSDLFGADCGVDYKRDGLCIRTDAQWVVKSVGNYLSKYLSKTAGAENAEGTYYPSRWWAIDKRILAEIIAQTILTVSKVLPYNVAIEVFRSLTVNLSLIGEKFYGYANRFRRYERVFLCWLKNETPTGAGPCYATG